MRRVIRPWEAEEPLGELTLWADWDYTASSILSLRSHLFEYGTIPTWNFMFCGGRPELGVPSSWAYSWPSLFAYLLPPNYAIIAVWMALTPVGFFSARALFRRWSGSRLGAAAGAAMYVLSGYFATRFNAGHVTWAFFHLVPLLMYLFEVSFARALLGRRTLGLSLLTTLAAFLFMSAGLPQPLLYFYPAFLSFVAFRISYCAKLHGVARSLGAALVTVCAHVLGLWLAAYKLWPAIRWQLDAPRTGVLRESYRLPEVISNTLIFVPDYFGSVPQQPWHLFPPWGYNAFVGPIPWLLAVVAALGLARAMWMTRETLQAQPNLDATCFGFILLGLGLALALGNDNPWSPAYLFSHVPILNGVRAFNRYHILIVFGLAILTAQGFAVITAFWKRNATRTLVLSGLAVGVVAPVLLQTLALVWNIHATPKAWIHAGYPGDVRRDPGSVHQLRIRHRPLRSSGHMTSVLERGYWIPNCYTNVTLPGPDPAPWKRASLSFPPPERLERLGRNRITLRYPADRRDRVVLNLRVLDTFQFNVDTRRERGGRVSFDSGDLPDGRFTMTATHPGPWAGACASVVALLATAAFFFEHRRRGARDLFERSGGGRRTPAPAHRRRKRTGSSGSSPST